MLLFLTRPAYNTANVVSEPLPRKPSAAEGERTPAPLELEVHVRPLPRGMHEVRLLYYIVQETMSRIRIHHRDSQNWHRITLQLKYGTALARAFCVLTSILLLY